MNYINICNNLSRYLYVNINWPPRVKSYFQAPYRKPLTQVKAMKEQQSEASSANVCLLSAETKDVKVQN